jgi:xanthine dehydrogenase accessory factor
VKDDALILEAWRKARAAHHPAVLATVVKVSGSTYRRPGARMLITEGGDYIGSVSGGCLESDLAKKAWWLTDGTRAAMRVYDNTSDEDAVWSFGLGCDGVVHVLVERWMAGSEPVLIELLDACAVQRRPGLIATVLEGSALGQRATLFPDGSTRNEIGDGALAAAVEGELREALEAKEQGPREVAGSEVFFETILPPRSLVIFGAGYDAAPLVRLGKELGWQVTVLDGRAHYAKPERFPLADRVLVADLADPLAGLALDEETAAVVMSHSLAQDLAFVKALLPRKLPYVGLLGPRRRTDRILAECAWPAGPEVRGPAGLDIGAETPEEIALAIVSEIESAFAGRPGGRLSSRSGPIHLPRGDARFAAVVQTQ